MRQKKTKQMLAYWMDLFEQVGNPKSNNGPLMWPDRSDIQPAACRSILSDMFILETLGGSVNYRLAGTKLCSMYGRELKHESFSEAFDGADQKSAENWASRLGQDDYLVLMCSIGETANGDRINIETLLLPLSHYGGRGKRILGITTTTDEDAYWIGVQPIVSQRIRSVRIMRPWESEGSERPVLQFPQERTKMDAPGLFVEKDDFLNEKEVQEGLNLNLRGEKKVGHLTVIDGGRT